MMSLAALWFAALSRVRLYLTCTREDLRTPKGYMTLPALDPGFVLSGKRLDNYAFARCCMSG